MKIYVTKYALTAGIQLEECEQQSRGDKESGYAWRKDHYPMKMYSRNEWQKSAAEAMKQAAAMRDRKIASLERQLAKLRAMTFQVPK